ncbi:MAG: hypothetical protein H7A24_08180 [Leptospiraceae bacterium]|nr:hypothetical protein [Leptospiraceae bacterium]MCP5511844.1 hypothetical protein [Leptospiraceae bacterium]
MITKLIPLTIELSYDREEILKNWQIFRKCLVDIFEFETLPLSFTEKDGEISKNTRVHEEDFRYDLIPIEFNYTWDCQILHFLNEFYKTSITINQDEFKNYISFQFIHRSNKEEALFYLSEKESYLYLTSTYSNYEIWKEAYLPFKK